MDKNSDGTPIVTPPAPPQDPADVDHKAEVIKLNDQLKKAEHTIKVLKDKPADAPVDINVITEQVRENLSKDYEKKLEENRLKDAEDVFQDELDAIQNADEREHVKIIYQTRITKTGFSRRAIREDLQNARLIANRPKIEKNMSELRTAASSGMSVSRAPGAAGQPIEKNTDLTKDDEASIASIARNTGVSIEKVKEKYLKNKQVA